MKVSASVVIYNEDKKTLSRVMESFLGITFQKELIIIDNSPTNILEEFCSSFDGVRYIFSGSNLGFGAGHNLAFSYKTFDSIIHVIINPDTYFKSHDMLKFLEWFESSQDIALAVPKVLNPDGSIQNVIRNIPSILSLFKRKLGVDKGEWEIPDNSILEIPFAHGCFMVFKTDTFKQVKGFDERFFMYMEDVDIFIRAKKYGKTVMNPNYKIYHEHRKGSSKSWKLFWIHLVSALKFFWKYRKYNY